MHEPVQVSRSEGGSATIPPRETMWETAQGWGCRPLTTVTREGDLPPAHQSLGGIRLNAHPLKGQHTFFSGQQIDDVEQSRDLC